MAANEKKSLIEKLSETYTKIHKLLEGVDLETSVYGEDNWRIRDILGHLATWDRELIQAIQAYQNGEVYINSEYSGGETEFNERAVFEQRKLTTEQILAEWEGERDKLKQVIKGLPEDKFNSDFEYPWGGEHGTVVRLVNSFIAHDIEHMDEIKKAL